MPGAQIPWPYGGKQRQIMVDIDPARLYAWGLSPRDVNTAIGLQNVILPTGTAKMGDERVPGRRSTASPEAMRRARRPADQDRATATTDLRARRRQRARRHPRRRPAWCTSAAGARVLMSILKNGNASTLDVAARIRDMLPQIAGQAAEGAQGLAALRSVGLRARGRRRRGQGGGHRRRPDRAR